MISPQILIASASTPVVIAANAKATRVLIQTPKVIFQTINNIVIRMINLSVGPAAADGQLVIYSPQLAGQWLDATGAFLSNLNIPVDNVLNPPYQFSAAAYPNAIVINGRLNGNNILGKADTVSGTAVGQFAASGNVLCDNKDATNPHTLNILTSMVYQVLD